MYSPTRILQNSSLFPNGMQLRLHFVKLHIFCSRAKIHYDRVAGLQTRQRKPEHFPRQALESVTDDGAPHFASDCNTQASWEIRGFTRTNENMHSLSPIGNAMLIGIKKIGALAHAIFFAEEEPYFVLTHSPPAEAPNYRAERESEAVKR